MIGSNRIRIALVLALMACSRSHEGSELDIRNRSNTESGQAGARGQMPEIAGSTDGRNRGAQLGAPSDPGAIASDAGPSPQTNETLPTVLDDPATDGSEVFVGQLWGIEQTEMLCSPDMRDWADSELAVDPTGYLETTTLILERVGETDLGGSIRFGEGEAPASPGDAPFANGDSGSYWLCSRQLPTRGVEYTLYDAKQYADRLTFSIIPGDVWNPWCAMQTAPCGDRACDVMGPICQCTPDGCTSLPPEAERPGSGPSRLSFNLAITANTIEGQPPLGSGFGTPADLRLQRQR